MGIFRRVKDIAAADLHSALDRLEDPVSMLNQYLRDLEKEMEKGHAALANQLFIEKKYEALISDTEAMIIKRTRQAKLAVSQQEEGIARLAVEDKILHESRLNEYKAQYAAIKEQTQNLCLELDKLNAKFEDLKNRKLALISRLNVANASANISKVTASFNPEQAARDFQRIEDYILRLESQSAASQYSSTKLSYSDEELTLRDDVEKELALLKESKAETA
jgi:phage shock protein A